MGSRKSRINVQLYTDVIINVLEDAYRAFPSLTSRDFEKDVKSLRNRVCCEGFHFLSVCLPRLGKAIDQALESGRLNTPSGFARKSKARERWSTPVFFSGILSVIFTSEGHLRRDGIAVLPYIRQICYLCYKVGIPPTPIQQQAAEEKFVATDQGLPSSEEIHSRLLSMGESYGLRVLRYARFLLRKVLREYNTRDIVPRHGPGAVADKSVKGRMKYEASFYSREIDQLYPYATFVTFGINTQNLEDLVDYIHLPRRRPDARVVFVPKDSRGPRVISAEPALLQYLQQGLARQLVRCIVNSPLTSGRINFRNQTVNRDLALSSSVDGNMATIDLADASDRVSIELVRMLLPEQHLPALFATRSEATTLPSGRRVVLKKFAPMGSAICFPLEALIFWSICTSVVLAVSRRPRLSSSPVYVYGDDIIIPSEHYELVTEALEAFGLKVNFDKSFVRGKFRESCGCDAYQGVDVTPVKLHGPVERARKSPFSCLYSLAEQASELFDRGYWSAAETIWTYVESRLGRLPQMPPTFPGIKRSSSILPSAVIPNGMPKRYNRSLQRWEYRVRGLRARRRFSQFPSEGARLGHNLLQGMYETEYDDYVAVPHSAQQMERWWAGI